jgi:RNA polymerase sigma-70 factor, ECF subfamily
VTPSLDDVIRVEGGQVLATLIRLTGDIDAAEDAFQDAVLTATEVWPRDGIPDKPGAWLTTVARNKALDRLRREARRADKEAEAVRLLTDETVPAGDDRLRLLFTCCHPALAIEAQVALALRTLCGLTTVEIARVFLIPETTAGQRISRAKAKIARARIPYRIPEEHELPARLPAVLACVYLVFTTGHDAPEDELGSRVDLCDEGIRLGRLLHELMPDEAEVTGLLALMVATNARRSARTDAQGELVLMADQDRALWDHAAITEAADLVEGALRRGRTGPYLVQAAISCLHGLAPTYNQTDWAEIAQLYAFLEEITPTAVVRVNRAVALAEASGPAAGLRLLDGLDERGMHRWHLYWSTRAELLRRAGDIEAALACYDRSLACSPNDTERRFIVRSRSAAATSRPG